MRYYTNKCLLESKSHSSHQHQYIYSLLYEHPSNHNDTWSMDAGSMNSSSITFNHCCCCWYCYCSPICNGRSWLMDYSSLSIIREYDKYHNGEKTLQAASSNHSSASILRKWNFPTAKNDTYIGHRYIDIILFIMVIDTNDDADLPPYPPF